MVRWIVLVMIAMNTVLFLWNNFDFYQPPTGSDAQRRDASETSAMPGDRLILLKESAATSRQSYADRTEALVNSPSDIHNSSSLSANTDGDYCIMLGPFTGDLLVNQVSDRLRQLGVTSVRLANIKIEDVPDYWVYLKPEASRELAVNKLRELQEKKIDSFIIPQGDLANGISLGVFDNQTNAERRRQAVIERGYDAELKANPRVYIEKWLVMNREDSARIGKEIFSEIRSVNGNGEVKMRQESCDKLASGADIQ